jgi:hypothetical protein
MFSPQISTVNQLHLYFQISKKMKYFGLYCLTLLPVVLCVFSDSGVPALDGAFKITNCQGLKLFNLYINPATIFPPFGSLVGG